MSLFFVSMFSSCYKNHLYVQQQVIDREFLASSYVGTPDPRQMHPPMGQRLSIGWNFPTDLFEEELTLVCTVRFWNQEQIVKEFALETRRGSEAFFFPAEDKEHRILTYRVDVRNCEGEVIETWKHHFWTELISAAKTNSSVSAQPKHGSVIETP